MKYITHNDKDDILTGGTSLRGYIKVTYETLCSIFGEPNGSDGYKSDAEWEVEWSDGTVATIYNWKDGKNYCGEEDGLDAEDIVEWHIGGKSYGVVDRIERLVKKVEEIYIYKAK